MIGPLGRLGTAATLGQHCPEMTQRRCIDSPCEAKHGCDDGKCLIGPEHERKLERVVAVLTHGEDRERVGPCLHQHLIQQVREHHVQLDGRLER